MNQHNFEDIQTEYKAFVENIYNAHSYLEDLTKCGNKFLIEYCKSLHCDKKFAEEFEINLIHIENLYRHLNDLLEMTDNISLLKLKMPEINNVIKLNNYMHLPDNYNIDIYVDLNNPISWTNKKDED